MTESDFRVFVTLARCDAAYRQPGFISTQLHRAIGESSTVIVAVKTAIPWGFLLLVPALIAAGSSGFTLAKGGRGGVIGAKVKRIPLIAGNGL